MSTDFGITHVQTVGDYRRRGDYPTSQFQPDSGSTLVYDDFSSGDLDNPDTNVINFSWNESVSTTVDPDPDTSSEALRLRYLTTGDPWAEQRFSFDSRTEVWLQYRIRVPSNFSVDWGNNKWIALWQDGYSNQGYGSSFWFTMWPGANGVADNSWSYSGNYTVSGGSQQLQEFIDPATDQGRWMTFVLHVNLGTDQGGNGVVEAWRKWDGENYEKMFNRSGVNFNVDGDGFRHGYLLGWANDGYSAETDWFIDDFKMLDSQPEDIS